MGKAPGLVLAIYLTNNLVAAPFVITATLVCSTGKQMFPLAMLSDVFSDDGARSGIWATS